MQAQLERWIAQGKVGSRTLKPGVMESSVYWRKRNTKDPVRAISAKVAIWVALVLVVTSVFMYSFS